VANVRTVETAFGATAVQIVWFRGVDRARSSAVVGPEMALLMAAAARRLSANQAVPLGI
jgi:hypothetical protein